MRCVPTWMPKVRRCRRHTTTAPPHLNAVIRNGNSLSVDWSTAAPKRHVAPLAYLRHHFPRSRFRIRRTIPAHLSRISSWTFSSTLSHPMPRRSVRSYSISATIFWAISGLACFLRLHLVQLGHNVIPLFRRVRRVPATATLKAVIEEVAVNEIPL